MSVPKNIAFLVSYPNEYVEHKFTLNVVYKPRCAYVATADTSSTLQEPNDFDEPEPKRKKKPKRKAKKKGC